MTPLSDKLNRLEELAEVSSELHFIGCDSPKIWAAESPGIVLSLIHKLRVAMQALEDAAETIHDEFCGGNGHHGVCDRPRKALAEIEKE